MAIAPLASLRTHRLVLAAALAGLALRLGFALVYWQGKPLTHDEVEYLLLARSLAAGEGFTYGDAEDASQRFGRVPVYPLFIALVVPGLAAGNLPDEVPRALKIAQSIVGTAGILLIAAVAGRAARRPRAAVAAAWIAAVYPPLVWICAYALSEAFYAVLALGAVWLLGASTDVGDAPPRHWGVAAGAGAVGGVATLTRPGTVFFLPLAFVWLAGSRRYGHAAALALGAVLVIAPWSIRNTIVHGRLVPVSSQGGVTFWTGNNPLARGEGDLAANPAMKRAEIELRRRHPGLTAEQLEPVYWREGFRFIAGDPLGWLGLLARKLFYTFVPIGPSYTLHSTRYFAASVISYGALLPFALAGVRVLWRTRPRPVALALMAASAVMVCLVFFPQERFRVPVIDPALIVSAAAWSARGRGVAAPRSGNPGASVSR
jgi:hypothetical protein